MISVIQPGLFTTVQDEGRWGYQAYGMPVAGAMDRYACRIANIIAGNPRGTAVLEMTVLGGVFRFDQDCYVAITGAEMGATLDGVTISNWSAFPVPAGSELAFGYAMSGCRSYLAVAGGIATAPVLGSRSTYTRGGIGGLEGRALKTGDTLPVGPGQRPGQARLLASELVPVYSSDIVVRCMLGPQADCFTDGGIETFLSGIYTLSDEADRMGYRFEGPPVQHKEKADIVSDALCQGAIQVPGHGMPIVMMADRQTTGGYTKIGVVIGTDLALLAQAKPGDTVRFVVVTDEEAVAIYCEEQAKYDEIQTLFTVPPKSAVTGRRFNLRINGQQFDVTIEEV